MSKAKINKDGDLLISRGKSEILKEQVCPYSRVSTTDGIKAIYCGDHCPQFEDPIKEQNGVYCLRTCGGNTFFDKIEDERK